LRENVENPSGREVFHAFAGTLWETRVWHEPCFLEDMTIAAAEPVVHPENREQETTRLLRRLSPPLEPQTPANHALPRPDFYLLAPAPWPRGQFRIDPEL
jgi:hypothetical protein